MYTDQVMDHFRNPRNMGKLEDYSAVGKVGQVVCGDVMWVYIKVGEDGRGREIIDDISWETYGCAAAIATSSMVSEMARGKTLEEAIDITNQDVAEGLGGLPPVKMHCSALAADALNEAIHAYLSEKSREIPEVLEKRHQRVAKQMAILEKRYESLLNTQGTPEGSAEDSQ